MNEDEKQWQEERKSLIKDLGSATAEEAQEIILKLNSKYLADQEESLKELRAQSMRLNELEAQAVGLLMKAVRDGGQYAVQASDALLRHISRERPYLSSLGDRIAKDINQVMSGGAPSSMPQ